MKVTYTKTSARKILLTFLALVVLLSIAAIIVRSSITAKLERIAKLALYVDSNQLKPQQTLLLLQQAEEDFQESLLNPDSAKSSAYKEKLNLAFRNIDTLLKYHLDSVKMVAKQSEHVNTLHLKKVMLSDKLLVLKHSFDSLLTVYAQFNTELKNTPPSIVNARTKSANKVIKSNIDTIRVPVEKKGLFTRIKEALSKKNSAEKDVIVISRDKNTTTYNATQRVLTDKRKDFSKQLQQLQQRNVALLTMQKQLISLNSRLNNELELIIDDVKEINYRVADELKSLSWKNYQETSEILNKFYLISLFLVLTFAILLIIFIIRLNKSELWLITENKRSITMAQQKMDLLLHMSHEIRNPLTSIKGFLSIFSKTSLTNRQREMLDSIRSSSEMLLLTLNDTLDAAKMEHSEFKINSDPFNPDFTLNEVIDSMSYSATKKNLVINYQFNGDRKAIVVGDSFRLKQILTNLLSNAIKYTNEGSITVKADLDDKCFLRVAVTDTGAGISLDQQPNLFSKYYQTASSKGQVGTGLGLYICKQLIELQNGKIAVNSTPNIGTTFNFYIPFVKNTQTLADNLNTENILALLNGLSVLGVDDNELNLMFLKVLTRKWNIDFHQAANAEEALKIIEGGKIQLVLTDIQLPGMSGEDLLTAIRDLPSPISQIPVIAVSGFSDYVSDLNVDSKGFSGFISKPFAEQDLAKQLLKALTADPQIIPFTVGCDNTPVK